MKTKVCFACKTEKSVACFVSANGSKSPDKLAIACIECNATMTEKQKVALCTAHWRKNNIDRARSNNKRTHMTKTYGISIDQYQALLDEQKIVCAICGNACTSVSATGKVFDLAVDHNHATGVIRGLLCKNCNHGLGNFKEDVELLEAAIEYLKKHR